MAAFADGVVVGLGRVDQQGQLVDQRVAGIAEQLQESVVAVEYHAVAGDDLRGRGQLERQAFEVGKLLG